MKRFACCLHKVLEGRPRGAKSICSYEGVHSVLLALFFSFLGTTESRSSGSSIALDASFVNHESKTHEKVYKARGKAIVSFAKTEYWRTLARIPLLISNFFTRLWDRVVTCKLVAKL
jgi:hypothetical protein